MRETVLIKLPAKPGESYAWCLPGHDLETGGLDELKAAHAGARLIALAASENVALYFVQLAVKQANKLLQAVPYALEEQIAADVELQHFAIGPRQADGRTPVAVVEQELMASWLDDFKEHGLSLDALIPDALALPLSDSMLTVLTESNGRAVVRRGAFDGFATHSSVLSALLDEDDRQKPIFAINALETQLPTDWQIGRSLAASDILQALDEPPLIGQSINLLQGPFAPKRATDQWLKAARWPAALAASCLVLSVLNLALDNAAKKQAYESLQDSALNYFSQGFPDITRIVDPRVQAEQALARLKGGGSEDRFLSLMSQSVPALSKVNSLKLEGVNFREGALYLNLSGSDLQALEVLRAEFERITSLKLDVQSAQAGSDGVQIRLKVEQA